MEDLPGHAPGTQLAHKDVNVFHNQDAYSRKAFVMPLTVSHLNQRKPQRNTTLLKAKYPDSERRWMAVEEVATAAPSAMHGDWSRQSKAEKASCHCLTAHPQSTAWYGLPRPTRSTILLAHCPSLSLRLHAA